MQVDKHLLLKLIKLFHISDDLKLTTCIVCRVWAHKFITAHPVFEITVYFYTSFTFEESRSLGIDHCLLCLQNCFFVCLFFTSFFGQVVLLMGKYIKLVV